MKKLFLLVTGLLLNSCSTTQPQNTLEVVSHVDLSKYLGTWYEIARLPAWFEKDCFAATANYSLLDNGDIKVVNKCHKGTLNGPEKVANGKAWVVDKKTNAKLRVRFFWPFAGNYWIMDLDKNYEYAVVGEPERNYFWILSRSPQMDPTTFNTIVNKAVEQGYNLDKLIKTIQ